MAEDNMDNLINNIKNMVDSGNIPENIQELLKNFSNSNNSSDPNNSSDNNSSSNSRNNFENFSSIDVETILKMKNIIDSMNKKDDPRANLLYSLKPYLRSSRRDKLDQYVNLLNMTKIADVLKKDGGL